jgi:ElaB/YqjD/DUF883 family membrane-anchored ribosome-binding protein
MPHRSIGSGLLAFALVAGLASVGHAGETKAARVAEDAGDKVGEAADKTSAEAHKAGRAIKHKTKKVVRQTGAAVERTGDKIEEAAK